MKSKLSLIYETCGCIVFAVVAGILAAELVFDDITQLSAGPESILFSAFVACAALGYLLLRKQVRFSALKVEKSDLTKGVAVGLVLALINLPYGYILYDKPLPSAYAELLTRPLIFIVVFAVVISFIVPVVEEFLYREFIFQKYEKIFYRYSGYLLSCLLFYWAHDYLIQALISSLVLCVLYDLTKRLGSCVVAHISWNVCWMLTLVL